MATPFDATTWLIQTFLILMAALAALPVLKAAVGLVLVLGSRAIGREHGRVHALGLKLVPKFARVLLSAGVGFSGMATLAPAQAAPLETTAQSQAMQQEEQLVLDRLVSFGRSTSLDQPAPTDELSESVATSSSRVYKVVAGDSLWSIAQTALTSSGERPSNQQIDAAWRRIWQANLDEVGNDPSLILPGQRLRIPKDLHNSENLGIPGDIRAN